MTSKKTYLAHREQNSKNPIHDRRTCPVCIDRQKTLLRNRDRRQMRQDVADICGTSYAAAMRDMGR